jgi:predicted HTH transcriptional regulator
MDSELRLAIKLAFGWRLYFGRIALTERQMKIIAALNNKQKITIGEIAKLFNFTRLAALKEVAKLVTLNVIALVGKGRGAYYVRK